MHSSLIKSCLLALATASTAIAQIAGFDAFTQPSTPGSSIPAGQTYTIKWTPSSPAGQISIILLEGASNTTLQLGPTIASHIESVTGSYDWAVPADLPAFPYFGFKLSLDSDPMTFQYSTYFTITGLSASSSSSTGSGSASSGATSTTTVASTSVTVLVSQVGPTTSASTTTLSASLVTLNSTSSSNSTSTGVYKNSTTTATTTTSKSATGVASTTATGTSSSASATSSSGAAGNFAIGGSGLIGALFIGFGMLL